MIPIVYRANGNTLTVVNDDGAETELAMEWPIAEVVLIGDILVVRIEPPLKSCINENVFGVDSSGRIVWTIEKRKHIYPDSPYRNMTRVGTNVQLGNWDGTELIVDPSNGRVLEQWWEK